MDAKLFHRLHVPYSTQCKSPSTHRISVHVSNIAKREVKGYKHRVFVSGNVVVCVQRSMVHTEV